MLTLMLTLTLTPRLGGVDMCPTGYARAAGVCPLVFSGSRVGGRVGLCSELGTRNSEFRMLGLCILSSERSFARY